MPVRSKSKLSRVSSRVGKKFQNIQKNIKKKVKKYYEKICYIKLNWYICTSQTRNGDGFYRTTKKMLKLNIDKKVNEIFETNDYSKFKMILGNRRIKQSKVDNLVKKMRRKGWLKTVEITVNELFEIIDGQHRFIAVQLLGISFRYKIVKNTGIEEVRETNEGSNNWSLSDYIPSYSSKGIKSYVQLENFKRDFPELNLSICQMLLSNSMGNPSRELFESGDWKIKDYNTGILWGGYVMSLKPLFSGWKRVIFVRGLIKVLMNKPEFNFQEFLHKVELRPNMLVPCGTTIQYVEMIETIYNYKRTNKVSLKY